MTRKDYQLIAEAIRPYADSLYRNRLKDMESAVETVAIRIARALEKENPRFDSDKFMEACGFGGEK